DSDAGRTRSAGARNGGDAAPDRTQPVAGSRFRTDGSSAPDRDSRPGRRHRQTGAGAEIERRRALRPPSPTLQPSGPDRRPRYFGLVAGQGGKAPVRMGSHRSVMSGVGWVTHHEGTEHMIETASKTYTPRSGGCPAKSPSRN